MSCLSPITRGGAVALTAVLVLCGCGRNADLPARAEPIAFTLQVEAQTLTAESLHGKTVWLSFGYINCPDTVPRQLAALTPALAALSAEERARVQPLVVAVDPDRDPPAEFARYATYFHPQLVGAVADKAQLAALAAALDTKIWQQPARRDGQYAVVHSSDTFVIDPAGRLVAVLPPGAAPAAYRATLRKEK